MGQALVGPQSCSLQSAQLRRGLAGAADLGGRHPDQVTGVLPTAVALLAVALEGAWKRVCV